MGEDALAGGASNESGGNHMTTHTTGGRLLGLQGPGQEGLLSRLNSAWHERALWVFMVVVIGHWAEHIVQGVQIWVLSMPRPQALGGLGFLAPVLVSSEAMHFGFAVLMLTGLFVLRSGFSGSSRTWWNASLALQGWHFVEHFVLLLQVVLGLNFFGSPVPTSLLQPFIPRAELHLMYNLLVFVPMVVGMWLHSRPSPDGEATCSCSLPKDGEPVDEACAVAV